MRHRGMTSTAAYRSGVATDDFNGQDARNGWARQAGYGVLGGLVLAFVVGLVVAIGVAASCGAGPVDCADNPDANWQAPFFGMLAAAAAFPVGLVLTLLWQFLRSLRRPHHKR